MTPAFGSAPAAVVRVAEWPIEALQELGSADLAAMAASVDDPCSRAAFDDAYARELERERTSLWRRTGADACFRRGLALTSPALLARTPGQFPTGPRTKRIRHLETSLYRYLARAVGRVEPGGLWTSVTLAKFHDGEETVVEQAASRANVTPELAPFRDIFRALRSAEPYRNRGPFALNPTLQQGRDGTWCYARRSDDGAVTWQHLPEQGPWVAITRRLKGIPAGSRASLRTALGHVPPELAAATIDLGIDVGLIVGGLRFPTRFASPWDALAQGAELLEPAHRQAWRHAVATVARACERVGTQLGESPDGGEPPEACVERANRSVRQAIERLCTALELPGIPLPPTPLRCDLTSGLRISLGRRDATRLAELLDAWDRLETDHGGNRWHQQAAQVLASTTGGDLTSPPAEDCDVDVYTHAVAHRGPPLGALVLRPGRNGFVRPWIRGMSNVPTATHARHAYHLERIGDPLLVWFRGVYRSLWRECGVTVADLVVEPGGSPNLIARPNYTDALIDPWGVENDEVGLDDATLVTGPGDGSVLLRIGGETWAAHAFTATQLDRTDVITRRLMATSFDERAEMMPTSSERRPAPQVDDAVFEPRRFALCGADVRAIVRARGAHRYLAWQRLAQTGQWPKLVRLTVDGRPALLIPTDSIVALDAAFEGVTETATVRLEAVEEDGWVTTADGHHFAEVVLPVVRRDHLWQSTDGELDHARACPPDAA